MFGKITTLGAMVALLMTTGAAPAQAKDAKKSRPACCANHPASHAKCCTTGKAADCCGNPDASEKKLAAVCAVTGKPLTQCCGKKASQMPPCCQKGCKHAGKAVH